MIKSTKDSELSVPKMNLNDGELDMELVSEKIGNLQNQQSELENVGALNEKR